MSIRIASKTVTTIMVFITVRVSSRPDLLGLLKGYSCQYGVSKGPGLGRGQPCAIGIVSAYCYAYGVVGVSRMTPDLDGSIFILSRDCYVNHVAPSFRLNHPLDLTSCPVPKCHSAGLASSRVLTVTTAGLRGPFFSIQNPTPVTRTKTPSPIQRHRDLLSLIILPHRLRKFARSSSIGLSVALSFQNSQPLT